ncbi:capsular biosynthesis protein [Cupriavidus sp. SHE]|jgi:capsular polysaccharide export protein|nr:MULTISPECIES: capsular biosynthesis protein [Cupriavidus]KWR84258.1 capsular biosynthesis protein [Cupriavidus sp. SHE]
MNAASPRNFLFLQGPPGAFFSRLATALRAGRHTVHRINFHGGDALDWRAGPAISWRGRESRWPEWLVRQLSRLAITDLVLFGDCRPLHQAAIRVATRDGLRVHVFEEGYLRPDWITLERDGVNGYSSLPRDPHWYRARAGDSCSLPGSGEDLPVPGNFGERARVALFYYLAAWLSWPYFPHYASHRPCHPARELAGWAGQLMRRRTMERNAIKAFDRLAGRPYYLFPLQLDSDFQLRVHSPFGGIADAMRLVIKSFALSAPEDCLLVLKSHPLDNGVTDWHALAMQEARRLGTTERLVWFDAGDIDVLSRNASGMVTVNSTTGTLALAAGVPVHVLGSAVYDMPGLTDQQELAAFWHAPCPPDPALFDAFRRVLRDRCLLRGGFHNTAAIDLLIAPVCKRLLAGDSAVNAYGSEIAIDEPLAEVPA